MKQAAESLLHVATDPGGGGVAEGNDISGILDEVAKLQRLLSEVQQQLERQHKDLRGWLGERLETIIDADTGAMEQRDFLVAMVMAMRSEGFDTPRQACVLPPWPFAKEHGLSEEEQAPEVWIKRLNEWRKRDFKQGKGLFKKKKRLFLVCAHTHRLVPCGTKGQGYKIEHLRTWVRTSANMAAFALQVVCSTLAAIAAAPLSAAAGGVVEGVVSEALGSLKSELEGLALGEGSAHADNHFEVTHPSGRLGTVPIPSPCFAHYIAMLINVIL